MLLAAALAAQQPPKRPAMPDNVLYEPNLDYSSAIGGKLLLDIVRPRDNAGAPHPAVLCIHGGGFRAGTRESYLPLCIRLAQRGYVAATVTYRLAPQFQFPAPLHDVKAAVRYLRANAEKFGIDPDRIGVTGGSAGGELALMLGLTPGVAELEGYGPNLDRSSRVSCVVDYFGPTDFTRSYGHSVDAAQVLPQFLGGDLEHAPAAHRMASPLFWVSPASAPVLAIHGTKDRYVAFEQSTWLIDRMKAAGVEAELVPMEGSDHGFKGDYAERAEKLLMDYFDKHLAPVKEERRILVSNHGAGGEVMELSWPSGRVLWRVPNQHGHDVQGLENGHVLYTIGAAHKVVEMDAQHRPVWEYSEGLSHPLAAERLANGDTVIGDAQLGKVIEVNAAGKVVWQYENPEMANMRMRSVRRTEAGTTLISIERAGKVIEVDRAGKIIWTFEPPAGAKRLPYQAHRLANGHTVVGLADPGEVVEVDAAGRIVRTIAGAKDNVKMGWCSGTQMLPGGGLIVSDYSGKRLIELDAAGAVVHELPTGAWGIASVSLAR